MAIVIDLILTLLEKVNKLISTFLMKLEQAWKLHYCF